MREAGSLQLVLERRKRRFSTPNPVYSQAFSCEENGPESIVQRICREQGTEARLWKFDLHVPMVLTAW